VPSWWIINFDRWEQLWPGQHAQGPYLKAKHTGPVTHTSVEIKCQLDATEVFIADLIACSTCFGHHYAHHQELKSIIQWLLPVVFRAVVFQVAGLVWSWGLCVRYAGCCSRLHLAGILFPHINDDARSKSHQTQVSLTHPSLPTGCHSLGIHFITSLKLNVSMVLTRQNTT